MYKYKSLQAAQLPLEHLSFPRNLLNFIIKKYLKQEVDDDLRVCCPDLMKVAPVIKDAEICQSHMIMM